MEREILEVDVLIVGAGPGLSAALRGLSQLQKESAERSRSPSREAREAGAHMLSGAVLDPSTLRDLVPDFEAKGAPLAARSTTIASTFSPLAARSSFRSRRRRSATTATMSSR